MPQFKLRHYPELRELARLRERHAADFASRLGQLHRAVDLGFPELVTPIRSILSSAGNSGLNVHLPLGMNPGMPVSTTELSLTRVLIP